MEFIKEQWRKFIIYIRDNRKKIVINYSIFLIVSSILLIADLVTKSTLFDYEKSLTSETQYQNWLFGIRSVRNEGLTFFGDKEINIGVVSFFNFLILFVCLGIIMFINSYTMIIFLSLIFAGSLGNTIDRIAFGYVRDIIFLPWADRGTFNLADCFAISGSIGMAIILIIQFIINALIQKNK